MNELGIWVTEHELITQIDTLFKWKINGIGMDGYNGFGSRKSKIYSGLALLISPLIYTKNNLEISLIHYSGQGLKWLIESEVMLPRSPFLITNNLDIHIVFDNCIKLEEDQDVIDANIQDGRYYSIFSELWFGIATVENNHQIHLIAFSNNDRVKVNIGDNLYSKEYDCSMGKIVWVDL